MSGEALRADVLVVGGGLAGSVLAHALAQASISTVLVDEHDPARLGQPSFDDRVTALANGSRRILEGLGLWADLAADAEPIRSIHVSERGCFGASRIVAAEEGVPALGYTAENRILGRVIWSRLRRADSLTCLAPARLDTLTIEERGVTARVDGRPPRMIRARLVVAADGARSPVRRALGVGTREDPYRQQAIIVNCETQLPHGGRAYERFTPCGPLAVLPMRRRRVAVVWTRGQADAELALGLADEEFRRELQEAFGYRLGAIERVGARAAYPLSRVRSTAVTAERSVLVGNAAFSLHPVAGQGFNLALRDIAALAETLGDARRAQDGADLGDRALLHRYRVWRAADQRRVSAFTHGLVRLFGFEPAPLAAARGLALMAFDLFPGAKGRLARHTMGLTGRLPRLARGLPLEP